MRVTVELSLYPLHADALAKILAFIDDVVGDARLEVVVNQMSTQIRGELDDVMQALTAALGKSFAAGGSQVLVAKFLNVDLPIGKPPELGHK